MPEYPQVGRRVDDHVGERIRTRRTELGLTQEELAQRLKISYQQIQKYETGANRISAGRLYEISQQLDADVSYFFDAFRRTRPRQTCRTADAIAPPSTWSVTFRTSPTRTCAPLSLICSRR